MARSILTFLTVMTLSFITVFHAALAETLPREEANNYGLVQTEGIVIPDLSSEKFDPVSPHMTGSVEFARNLRVGWNLGNTFDAYKENPKDMVKDFETWWSNAKTTRELIHAVRHAGFNVIRIPVSWHDHLVDEKHTIDPAWMARVKEVVDWAMEEGFYIILNIHHDNNLDYLYPDTAHYDQSEKYITVIWTQIAETFRDYNDHLIFESMNEPRLVGSPNEWNSDPGIPEVLDAMQCINKLNQKFIDTVRASGGLNTSRYLMIPGYAGSWYSLLHDEFELPMDPNLILMGHAYEPYDFALNRNSPDSSFDLDKDVEKKEHIVNMMHMLYERHIQHGVPVILDEFGAVYKKDSDLQARVNYAAYYAAAASAAGIPIVIWDNSNFNKNYEMFTLIDRNKVEWVYPDIVLALVKNYQ